MVFTLQVQWDSQLGNRSNWASVWNNYTTVIHKDQYFNSAIFVTCSSLYRTRPPKDIVLPSLYRNHYYNISHKSLVYHSFPLKNRYARRLHYRRVVSHSQTNRYVQLFGMVPLNGKHSVPVRYRFIWLCITLRLWECLMLNTAPRLLILLMQLIIKTW